MGNSFKNIKPSVASDEATRLSENAELIRYIAEKFEYYAERGRTAVRHPEDEMTENQIACMAEDAMKKIRELTEPLPSVEKVLSKLTETEMLALKKGGFFDK